MSAAAGLWVREAWFDDLAFEVADIPDFGGGTDAGQLLVRLAVDDGTFDGVYVDGAAAHGGELVAIERAIAVLQRAHAELSKLYAHAPGEVA